MKTKQIRHGSDEHLSLLGAPYHWNLLTGVDRADMLAFGRACMEVERERGATLIETYPEWLGPNAAREIAYAIRKG